MPETPVIEPLTSAYLTEQASLYGNKTANLMRLQELFRGEEDVVVPAFEGINKGACEEYIQREWPAFNTLWKAFVEEGAVENLATFTDQFNRVNAVIQVTSLAGIKVENLTREVLDQYTIIDKAMDRIQRVLSINDSFLGMAYASDSGSKVKLQQNQSIIALSYFTNRLK